MVLLCSYKNFQNKKLYVYYNEGGPEGKSPDIAKKDDRAPIEKLGTYVDDLFAGRLNLLDRAASLLSDDKTEKKKDSKKEDDEKAKAYIEERAESYVSDFKDIIDIVEKTLIDNRIPPDKFNQVLLDRLSQYCGEDILPRDEIWKLLNQNSITVFSGARNNAPIIAHAYVAKLELGNTALADRAQQLYREKYRAR